MQHACVWLCHHVRPRGALLQGAEWSVCCLPPAPPPPCTTSLARLTWLSRSTHPPYAFVSSCLAGDSPGNTPQATSPEQPPTPEGPGAASVQGARPAPQGLSPRLNLTGAVRVLCEIEKVAIAIQKRFLQQESIPESSLYLGHPSCNVSDHNSTHVILVAAWGECGTVMQSVRPGSDPPWGAGRGLRESGSRSREGPCVAWGAKKTLHPEASDSKRRRTQPRVRIGPSSHRGPGCTLVQGFWWKVRVYKSLPVILMHRRDGEPVGEKKGQESREPVRERVCLCARI